MVIPWKNDLVLKSELLIVCYGKFEDSKELAKAILTTPVDISYNNNELKVLSIEKAV